MSHAGQLFSLAIHGTKGIPIHMRWAGKGDIYANSGVQNSPGPYGWWCEDEKDPLEPGLGLHLMGCLMLTLVVRLSRCQAGASVLVSE
jgi:hypothetical protein